MAAKKGKKQENRKKNTEKHENLKSFYLFIRYSLVLAILVSNVLAFFLPVLTIKSVYYLINLFVSAVLFQNIIIFQGKMVVIIPACIALSAYYLLLILNFTTPMPLKKRIYTLVFSLLALFIINVIRIILFSFLLIKSEVIFTTLHFITWFFLSSVIVFLIWIAEIYMFKIKEVPVYTDIKFLLGAIKKH